MNDLQQPVSNGPRFRWDERSQAWATVAALTVAVVWSYWPSLSIMADRWANEPQYSHGFLVPLFAGIVLWFRQEQRQAIAWQPNVWGIVPLVIAGAMRIHSARTDIDALDALSLLPAIAGLVLLVGGTSVLRWAWPGIAFLAFMLPLPYSLEIALAHPLRRIATEMSTYTLQTMGYPAVSEGNVILMDQIRLGVADACSGLGMLMTFFALSTAMALVIQAPLTDKLVLVASSIPIAVLANVVRITATGVASYGWGRDAGKWVHDQGWFMMPVALLLMWLELKFLSKLLVVSTDDPTLPLKPQAL